MSVIYQKSAVMFANHTMYKECVLQREGLCRPTWLWVPSVCMPFFQESLILWMQTATLVKKENKR